MAASDLPPAIVIGLDSITGLQSCRLLAKYNIPVIGIARDLKHYCCQTNSCQQKIQVDTSGDALLKRLKPLGEEFAKPPVLFPCTDLSVRTLARAREQLADRFRLDLPSLDIVDTLMDKALCHDHAVAIGAPVPQTLVLHNRDDATRAVDQGVFPAVLKPAIKDTAWEQQAPSKAFRVNHAEELLDLYTRCAEWSDTLILQQWIEGNDRLQFTCNAYLDDRSQPVVAFVSQKTRQWPPGTGTACLARACMDPQTEREIIDLTVQLFGGLGYHGFAYAEWKRDERKEQWYLIEANVGRPTGRSAMAEAAGLPLLYTCYCQLSGLPLPQPQPRRAGEQKWIHWRRDLQAAWRRWRSGEETFRELWRSRRAINAFAIFDRQDLMPFLAELIYVGRYAVGLIPRKKP